MRRGGALLALAVTAALLGGCVYDPYSGLLVPCCSYYGYPYAYRYPPPYSPYGYPPGPPGPGGPYGGPPLGQPGPYAAPMGPGPGPMPLGGPPGPRSGGSIAQGFAAANVTHDGRLTRAQAAAGMPVVARNFDAIDFDRKGYVTLPEVSAFMAQRRAQGTPPGAE